MITASEADPKTGMVEKFDSKASWIRLQMNWA